MDPPTPAQKRYAEWYARNKESAKEYKRLYYASHPEYAQAKREKARERYHQRKGGVSH